MSRRPIYLDCNATTELDPRVAAVIAQSYQKGWTNPASQHRPGQRTRRELERVREEMGQMLGAGGGSLRADRLVLTSGATEANNLALFGLAGTRPGTIIISSIEHPSVAGPAEILERRGWVVHRVRVTVEGVVDLTHLDELLNQDVRLVSLMLGNNETGVVQPVAEAAALCRAKGVPLHTDATQAVGKMSVDFRALGVAALSFSGHKLHGPRGIGGLLLEHDVAVEPQLWGGFQQAGLRPGTECIELAIGLCKTLHLANLELDARRQRMLALRDRFEDLLRRGMANVVVVGASAERLPHTSQVAFLDLDRQALVMALDQAGVACSTGSACASGSTDPSPTLLAMRCDRAVVDGAVRFSWGALTEAWEIDEAAQRILTVANELRSRVSARKMASSGRETSPNSL